MRQQGKSLALQFLPTLYLMTKWRANVKPWLWKSNRRCLFSWASSIRGLIPMAQPGWMGLKWTRHVYLQNIAITRIIHSDFRSVFFFREENAVQILTSLSSIVMCCSHPCDQSLRCNQLGRGACAAAIHYPANLTVRSGCHLQAHTTSSWKRLDGSLARLREAWRFTSVYKRVYKIFMPFPAPCSYSPFWEFSFKCTLTFLGKVYKILLLLETHNKRKCIGNRTSSCIIQYLFICSTWKE